MRYGLNEPLVFRQGEQIGCEPIIHSVEQHVPISRGAQSNLFADHFAGMLFEQMTDRTGQVDGGWGNRISKVWRPPGGPAVHAPDSLTGTGSCTQVFGTR